MSTLCVPLYPVSTRVFSEEPCSTTAGWVPAGDRISTVFAPQDNNVFLVMMLSVAGFKGEAGSVDGKPIVLSTISFTFELTCDTPCQLLLLSVSLAALGWLNWPRLAPNGTNLGLFKISFLFILAR